MTSKVRDSNFELLRLVCMACIVLYHMLIWGLNAASHDHWLYKSFSILLHFAVVDFVFISGWYGIKLSVRRLLNIIVPLIVYTCIINFAVGLYFGNADWRGVVQIVKCDDSSPLWFIQPYIFLCLLSPMINIFFDNSSKKQQQQMLFLLSIIVFVFGWIGHYAVALEGKTIICFVLFYLTGRYLRTIASKELSFTNTRFFIFIWGALTICIILFKWSGVGILSKAAGAFYAYNSPLLYVYSILILLIFSRLNIKSMIINKLAKGSFSIYLIASNPFVMSMTTAASVSIYKSVNNPYLSLMICFVFAIILLKFPTL